MQRENNKKVYTGMVVSDSRDKSITVLIETYKRHSLYSKRVKTSKKFHAHDELNDAKIGDRVTIIESRPYSKLKKFRLLKIVSRKEVV